MENAKKYCIANKYLTLMQYFNTFIISMNTSYYLSKLCQKNKL